MTKITDKANLLKYIIEHLVDNQEGSKERVDRSGIITCDDCKNYEASLQKLEGEVRQHIRVWVFIT